MHRGYEPCMRCDHHRPTFEVVAHRLDHGARWELHAVDVPGAHVEVIDLADGSDTIRTVLDERLDDVDDFDLSIVLA